ncbi:MAG TPA: helix-turn-helix domain-containing protein [Acidimicrobiales bacterium]
MGSGDAAPSPRPSSLSSSSSPRRRYDSPVRRQRAAETRDRIVAAGAAILHEHPVWDWRALTVRAAAERAGVNERTVYRHFATERDLRDAVFRRLEEEAGVELEGMALDDVRAVTARTFAFVSSFPLDPRTPRDPTLVAANERRRAALLAAVEPYTAGWSAADRALAAALLDVLWGVPAYERLVADWELDPKEAARGLTWVIRLVEDAIRAGQPPGPAPAPEADAASGPGASGPGAGPAPGPAVG